jgi:hypothetical protein
MRYTEREIVVVRACLRDQRSTSERISMQRSGGAVKICS